MANPKLRLQFTQGASGDEQEPQGFFIGPAVITFGDV
jgi:hypothetical protein